MKYITYLVLLQLSALVVNSQDTIPTTTRALINTPLNTCIAYKEGIAVLSSKGDIYHINLRDYSSRKISRYGYSVIAVDRKDMLWAVDSFSSYYSLQDTGWKWEGVLAGQRIWQIQFSRKNTPVLITTLGVYNPETNMFYGENRYRQRYSSEFTRTGYNISCAYVDDKDNLWMALNTRISKEIHVFSLRKNKFITSQLKGLTWFYRVQDIFGDEKDVFFADLDYNFGMSAIMTYRKDTMIRIHHPEYDTTTRGPAREEEEFIAAGFYKASAKEIYYFSAMGLVKCNYNRRKRMITSQQVLIPVGKEWNGYEYENSRFATGLKGMFHHKEKIVYFHKEKGIYVFDGKSIVNIL